MRRRMLMTALAVVLALVGTGAVYAYVDQADARAVADLEPTSVLVVEKRIPAGTTAGEVSTGGYLRVDRLPASATPSGAVRKFDPAWRLDVATTDLQPGQVVVRDMFGTKPPTTSGLVIPGSKLAVSLELTTQADVAGYVQPGSQIAIYDTFILLNGKDVPSGSRTSSDKNDNWATKVLLPRVEVLAVSQAAPHGTKDGLRNADRAATANLLVTLAVDESDAARLIHVAQTGMPYAALLSSHSVSGRSAGVDNQHRLGPVFAGQVAP